jgi:hypothetical protein
MNTLRLTFLYLSVVIWASCNPIERDIFLSGEGKVPVYVPLDQLTEIKNTAPRTLGITTSIAIQDSLFFLIEPGAGIHVFDISDTLMVEPLTFWQVPAGENFSLQGNRLYVSSWRDLVTIDISDVMNIRVIDRATNVFEPILYPPLYRGIFECVDETKGAVIGWRDTTLFDVQCQAE